MCAVLRRTNAEGVVWRNEKWILEAWDLTPFLELPSSSLEHPQSSLPPACPVAPIVGRCWLQWGLGSRVGSPARGRTLRQNHRGVHPPCETRMVICSRRKTSHDLNRPHATTAAMLAVVDYHNAVTPKGMPPSSWSMSPPLSPTTPVGKGAHRRRVGSGWIGGVPGGGGVSIWYRHAFTRCPTTPVPGSGPRTLCMPAISVVTAASGCARGCLLPAGHFFDGPEVPVHRSPRSPTGADKNVRWDPKVTLSSNSSRRSRGAGRRIVPIDMEEEDQDCHGGMSRAVFSSSATLVDSLESKSTGRSGDSGAPPVIVDPPVRRAVMLQRYSSRDESSARSTGRTDRTTGRESQRSARARADDGRGARTGGT